MVISVAAKAVAKIAAKKRAIANAHRLKKTAKPRVKRRVKRKAVVEAKRTAKWQKHDKAVFDRVKTREGMIGLNRTKPKLKGIHGKGAAASDNMSDSDLKRNLVGTSKDGIYHTGLETSRIHTAPAARTRVYVPPPKGNLQDKELSRILPPGWTRMGSGPARRQGAWFQGPPPPDTWKGILTDKESLGFAIPTSAAFAGILGVHSSSYAGKTLTGADLPKPKDKKPGRR